MNSSEEIGVARTLSVKLVPENRADKRKSLVAHKVRPMMPQEISEQIISSNVHQKSFVPVLVNEAITRQKTLAML